ncbi:MAG TPA: hypothetical protein VFJ57_00790 [Solirubrobacterales bacterium]|nr:hypothetical protein [Solirubrobacterales bacterium]
MKTGARALDLLRQRPPWIAPLVVGSVLIAIITVLYVGSTVDPLSHMHPILLWLYSWLCAATVAVGTLALIAALGTQGSCSP